MDKNLTEEAKEELKRGNINFTEADNLAKLSTEKQKEVLKTNEEEKTRRKGEKLVEIVPSRFPSILKRLRMA